MTHAFAFFLLLGAATLPVQATRVADARRDLAKFSFSESPGPIVTKLASALKESTAALKELSEVPPVELQVEKLHDALLAAASAMAKTGPASSSVATQVTKNAKMLSACPDFGNGGTVESCLQDEEHKQTLQDKSNGKPAVLTDPSPSMGLLWCSRILRFMVDAFEKAVAGERLHDAAMSSYNDRIRPAFAKCTVCTDYAVKKLITSGLTAALRDEDYLYNELGGKGAGRSVMEQFAKTVRPLVDSIASSIIAHRLDDSKGY